MRALVCGAAGAVGRRLVPALEAAGWDVLPTDLETADVRDPEAIRVAVEGFEPDVVFHLAAWKEAGAGELDPAGACAVNALGTRNVVDAASAAGARVVLASTCKAADPETAYGASKLIAERIVMNAGGSVVRFYNIPECGGEATNVFDLWASLPADEPIPFTGCWRWFITAEQAVEALLFAAEHEGRFAPRPRGGWMADEARRLYPGRELVKIPLRRGDRREEPLCARCERIVPSESPSLMRVVSPHDPVRVAA